MIIFGTALLAVCHLPGIFIGDLLGQALGVKTNVGGVGIAMLLLIFARLYVQKNDKLPKLTELGVEYWGAMYIPSWWRWRATGYGGRFARRPCGPAFGVGGGGCLLTLLTHPLRANTPACR